VFDWSIEIHERTLTAIRSRDMNHIDVVMDEHLRQLEEVWEHETNRTVGRIPIGKLT